MLRSLHWLFVSQGTWNERNGYQGWLCDVWHHLAFLQCKQRPRSTSDDGSVRCSWCVHAFTRWFPCETVRLQSCDWEVGISMREEAFASMNRLLILIKVCQLIQKYWMCFRLRESFQGFQNAWTLFYCVRLHAKIAKLQLVLVLCCCTHDRVMLLGCTKQQTMAATLNPLLRQLQSQILTR